MATFVNHNKGESKAADAALAAGDVVVCKYPGFAGKPDDPFFKATVVAVEGDTADVRYADGDTGSGIPLAQILKAPGAPDMMWRAPAFDAPSLCGFASDLVHDMLKAGRPHGLPSRAICRYDHGHIRPRQLFHGSGYKDDVCRRGLRGRRRHLPPLLCAASPGRLDAVGWNGGRGRRAHGKNARGIFARLS